MSSAVPQVEVAHHQHTPRIRRPHREAGPGHAVYVHRIGSQAAAQLEMPSFGQQMHVELAQQQAEAVRVFGNLHLFAAVRRRPGDAQAVRHAGRGGQGGDDEAELIESLVNVQQSGLFVSGAPALPAGMPYRLRITWPTPDGGEQRQITEDPYSFGLLLGELDMHLLAEGRHFELGRCLGANPMNIDGMAGTRFAVWAPNARRVSVVGDFNLWDGRRHPMRRRVETGVWELFIPRIGSGARYKYEIVGADGNLLPQKADTVARATEAQTKTASLVSTNIQISRPTQELSLI